MTRLLLLSMFFPMLAVLAAGCGSENSTATGPTFTGAEKPYRLTASLNRAQVVPKPTDAKGAAGSFSGTIEPFSDQGTLNWHLTYTGLSSRATAAHITLGKPGKRGLDAIALCAPCSQSARGSIGANAALLQAVLARPAYVDVYTVRNPRGEIRGRLRVIRPPGTASVGG